MTQQPEWRLWWERRKREWIAANPTAMPGNVRVLEDAWVELQGDVLVVWNLNSPVLRGIVERWAVDGDPPPVVVDRLRVERRHPSAARSRPPAARDR